MSGGAVIVRRQNRYIRAFRQAGAASPETACALNQISLRKTWVFSRMAARGVFVRVGGDRWYIDEQAVEPFLRGRRNRILIAAAIVLVVIVLIMFLAN